MQNFLLGTVTEVNTENNHAKVKLLEYDNVITPDFIPVMLPPIGNNDEGQSSPLGIDDLVVIAFFDKEMQNAFVLGKIYSSNEFISDKKIRFFQHEIEFKEDQITIIHKGSGTKIIMKENEIIIESDTVKLGDGATEAVIKGDSFQAGYNSHVHLGNLGYPTTTPTTPSPPTDLSTKVKTE